MKNRPFTKDDPEKVFFPECTPRCNKDFYFEVEAKGRLHVNAKIYSGP